MHQATYRPILAVSNGRRLALEVWHTPGDSLTSQQQTLLLALKRNRSTPLALPLSSAVIAGILVDYFVQVCQWRPLLILWQPDRDPALSRRQHAIDVLNRLAQAGVLVIADGWCGSGADEQRVAVVPGLWGARLAPHLLGQLRHRAGHAALLDAVERARSHGLQTIVSDAAVDDVPLLRQFEVDWTCPAAAQPADEANRAAAAA